MFPCIYGVDEKFGFVDCQSRFGGSGKLESNLGAVTMVDTVVDNMNLPHRRGIASVLDE